MKADKYIQNYIGGKLVPPLSGKYLENIAPATGKVYSFIPDSDDRDVELAIQAAKAAFPTWSKADTRTRFRLLMRIADILEQYLEVFAQAESMDSGKTLKLATEVDIPRAQSNFRFFATSIIHFPSESHYNPGESINYTLRQPLGVVGCISPWNLPLYLLTWKIAPALAAGNCVVAKPSELTPMTAYLLAQACIKAGLPDGVLNIVHGYGSKAGQALVEHPSLKAISFTGGTETGRKIALTAAYQFKKISLEMGGKNPNIIFADCDFASMMATTIRSSFSNNGQICLCGSRIYVERPIYEQFRDEFVKRTQFLKVGDPKSTITDMGAIVSQQQYEKVLSYIKLAQEEGATILTGGQAVQLSGELSGGYYIRPTILEGLDISCRTNQEEIFGPVVTITPFDTEEEVLAYANGTQYGLSTTLWTQNLSRANRMAEQLEAGIVWINCWMERDLRTPFGGVKNSGLGREGGFEVLRFFTEPKNVCIKY